MRRSLKVGLFLSFLLILLSIGVYHVLATGGALDPKRCAENGGRWDGGIDVCHFD